MTEYCQCPRRETRQTREFRESGYYCQRCKKILDPNPHAPQYHQTSLSDTRSTPRPSDNQSADNHDRSQQSTPSPGPLLRSQFQNSITSALDLISISANSLREIGDNVNNSYSNTSDTDDENQHSRHTIGQRSPTHREDEVSVNGSNNFDITITNSNQVRHTSEQNNTNNHAVLTNQDHSVETGQQSNHSDSDPAESNHGSHHSYEELEVESEDEFQTPGKDTFRNSSLHQSTHEQEETQQQPSQQEDPIYAELEPETGHITPTVQHTPTTRSHRRQLFSPVDTGANRTSSTLHTIDNWILQQPTPIHEQPQITSEHNSSNQNTPIQPTHTHISTQRTPVKPKRSVPNPDITNNAETSRLSDIFTTPPRTPGSLQNLSQDIAVTSRKTSEIPRQRTSSPIHELVNTNIARTQVHFSPIRPSVIRNTISLSSDEESDGDQSRTNENQINTNQDTIIPSQNAEVAELEIIANTPHRQRRKMELERALKFKEVFSGDKSQNVEAFFDRFETWCAKQGHDDNYKLQNIVFCLDGSAYTSYKTMAPELKNNYANLKKELVTYYSQTKLPDDQLFQHLNTLRMQKTDTVQKFYNLLMKKTQDLNISEAQLQVLFKAALPRYIRRYVKSEKPKTLSETLIKAREAEELGSDYEEDDGIKEVKDSIKALMTKLDSPTAPIVSAMANNETSKCPWCFSTQHALIQCQSFQNNFQKPSVPETPRQNNTTSTQPTQYQGQSPRHDSCQYCGIRGHKMVDCFKFKAIMANGTGKNPNTQISCQLCGYNGHTAKQCNRSNNFQQQNSTQRPPFCDHCGKRGHVRKTCFLLNNQTPDGQKKVHFASNPKNQAYFAQNQNPTQPSISTISEPTRTINTTTYESHGTETKSQCTQIPVPSALIQSASAPPAINLDAMLSGVPISFLLDSGSAIDALHVDVFNTTAPSPFVPSILPRGTNR